MKYSILLIIAASLALGCQGNGLVDGMIEGPNGEQITDKTTNPDTEPTIIDKDGKETTVDPELVEKLASKCETRPSTMAGVPLRILTTNEINLGKALSKSRTRILRHEHTRYDRWPSFCS